MDVSQAFLYKQWIRDTGFRPYITDSYLDCCLTIPLSVEKPWNYIVTVEI